MANLIRIILVDDHETIRDGMRSYFETLPDFDVVGEAASGEEVLKLVAEALIANETVINGHVTNILSKLYLAGCLRAAVERAAQ